MVSVQCLVSQHRCLGFVPLLPLPDQEAHAEIFAYTATQELATGVSHRNAGKITDDPAAYELMRHIASDENHHFIFYKAVMKAMLDQAPELVIEGIHRVFASRCPAWRCPTS